MLVDLACGVVCTAVEDECWLTLLVVLYAQPVVVVLYVQLVGSV